MTMQLFTFGHPCEHQLRRTCIGGSSCPLNGYPDMWCCSYIKGKINFKRDKPCEGPRCRWGFNHPTQAQFTAVTRVLNEGRAIAGKIDEAEDGEILSFNIENTHTIDTVHCALNMMRHPPSSCAQRVGQLLAYAAVKTGEGKAFMQLLRTMKKPVDGYILGAYAYLKQHTASGANSAAQQKESANQSKATSGKPKANNAANSANKKDDVAEDLKNDMVDLMNAALSQGGHLVHRDDQHKLQAVFIQALRQYPKSNKKRAEMLELALGKFGNRQPSKDDAVTPAATKPAHVASAATADSAESAAEQPQKSAPASNNNANAATSNNASGKSATGGSHVEKRTSGSAAAASASVAGTASDASSTTTPTSTATQKLSAGIAASAAASHLGAGSATGANATDSSSKTSSNVAPAATVAQMLADSRRATNNNNNSTHTAASSSNGATASTSTSVSKSSTARSVAEQGATYSSVAGATSLNTVTPVAAAAATTTTTTTISAVTASVTTPAAHGKAAAAAASATVQAGAEMSVAANTTATHTPSVTAAAAAAGVSPVHSVQEKLTLNGPSRRSQTPNINCVTPVTLSEVNANTSNTTPAGIPSAVNTAAASFSLCPASSATTPHISSLPPQVQLPTQPQQAMTSEFAHPASAMFGKRVRNKLNISKLASLCTTESSSSPPSPLRSVAYTPVRAESALPSIFILGGQFALTPSMAHAAPLGLASSSGVNMSSYKELSSDPTVASSAACMVPHAAMNSMHGQGAAPNTVNMPPPQQQQPSTLFGENLFGNITAEPMFDNLDAAQLFKDFAEGWTC